MSDRIIITVVVIVIVYGIIARIITIMNNKEHPHGTTT
jgi:hypothetical protein